MGPWQRSVCLFVLLIVSILNACYGFKFQQSFVEPVYDNYGNEISNDRVLEIMDMKSTLVGYGFGFNVNQYGLASTPRSRAPPFAQRNGFTRRPILMGTHPGSTRQPSYHRLRSTPKVSYHRNPYSPDYYRSLHSSSIRPTINSQLNKEIMDHLSRIPLGLVNRPTAESFFEFPTFFPDGRRVPSGLRRLGCHPPKPIKCNAYSRFRTIDGLCNNLEKPKWGSSMQPLRRLHSFNYYHDGYDIPRMTSTTNRNRLLPSARLVSRSIHEPDRRGQEIHELTNLIQVWGQFTDHDITGTPAHKDAKGKELECCKYTRLTQDRPIHPDAFNGGPCHPIFIPPLDRHFAYSCMNFARSQPVMRKRDCDPSAPKETRNQMNMLTSYLDGSQVYGSSLKDNNAIRLYRYGMLRVTPLDLLPEDKNVTCVKDFPGDYCFRAGEMRVNEHPALSSIHTVFHRLHNQMAIALTRINPGWNDDTIFQEVRKIMGAVMQFITYHEWLPIILGRGVMDEYGLTVRGLRDGPSNNSPQWFHDRNADATVFNAFATAAFRFGHTLIPGTFTVGRERIPLHKMFNNPHFVLRDGGRSVSKFCSGLLHDTIQHFDRFITTELSDRLFEDRQNISLDLAALNIQRARDHGLPTYNDYREICGLPRIRSFNEWYIEEPERANVFRRVYDNVDDIDLFSGGISERPLAGAIVGHTFACIIARQFRNIKYGDRFWYESSDPNVAFTPEQVREIRSFSLSRVICTMAPLEQTLVNPFYKDGTFLPEPVILTNGEIIIRNRYVPCHLLKSLDMNVWHDPKASLYG